MRGGGRVGLGRRLAWSWIFIKIYNYNSLKTAWNLPYKACSMFGTLSGMIYGARPAKALHIVFLGSGHYVQEYLMQTNSNQ